MVTHDMTRLYRQPPRVIHLPAAPVFGSPSNPLQKPLTIARPWMALTHQECFMPITLLCRFKKTHIAICSDASRAFLSVVLSTIYPSSYCVIECPFMWTSLYLTLCVYVCLNTTKTNNPTTYIAMSSAQSHHPARNGEPLLYYVCLYCTANAVGGRQLMCAAVEEGYVVASRVIYLERATRESWIHTYIWSSSTPEYDWVSWLSWVECGESSIRRGVRRGLRNRFNGFRPFWCNRLFYIYMHSNIQVHLLPYVCLLHFWY